MAECTVLIVRFPHVDVASPPFFCFPALGLPEAYLGLGFPSCAVPSQRAWKIHIDAHCRTFVVWPRFKMMLGMVL